MENEHCTNVTMFRAEREVPLPYHLEQPTAHAAPFEPTLTHTSAVGTTSGFEPADLESIRPPTARRRKSNLITDSPALRALHGVGAALSRAHAQDFERRRVPVDDTPAVDEHGSDDEDEEDSGEGDGSDGFVHSESEGSTPGERSAGPVEERVRGSLSLQVPAERRASQAHIDRRGSQGGAGRA